MPTDKPNEDQSAKQLRDQAEALLSQARTQLAEIQRALGAVVGDGALQARLAAVAAQISGAVGTLWQALNSPALSLRPADLTALATIVQSTETTSLIAEATAQTGASGPQMQALAAASAATRQEAETLSRDLYERRVFDRYLQFDSTEDEAEYRAREAERQQLIARDLAQHTPEGNLNAAIREAGQMADAGTHGADASPDFQPRWQHLVETIHHQRDAMLAQKIPTEKADQLLRDQLRQSLHGVPPGEVERILAADDPLQAVGPYLNAQRVGELEKTLSQASAQQQEEPGRGANLEPPTPPAPIRAAVVAAAITLQAGVDLSAAGLSMNDATPASEAGHGLPIPIGTPPARTATRS